MPQGGAPASGSNGDGQNGIGRSTVDREKGAVAGLAVLPTQPRGGRGSGMGMGGSSSSASHRPPPLQPALPPPALIMGGMGGMGGTPIDAATFSAAIASGMMPVPAHFNPSPQAAMEKLQQAMASQVDVSFTPSSVPLHATLEAPVGHQPFFKIHAV